jgi:hypothetical protein
MEGATWQLQSCSKMRWTDPFDAADLSMCGNRRLERKNHQYQPAKIKIARVMLKSENCNMTAIWDAPER